MSVRKPAPAQEGDRLSHVMQVGYTERTSAATAARLLDAHEARLLDAHEAGDLVTAAREAMAKRPYPHWTITDSQEIAAKLIKVFKAAITESVFYDILGAKHQGVELTLE
eukprot:1505441-Prymnesium_polylepis.2